MRVTKEDLRVKVERLSEVTGQQLELSGAYGGYNVVISETGNNLLRHGHIKAKELYNNLECYMAGYFAAKEGHL